MQTLTKRYRVTSSLLSGSTNPYIQNLVKNQFIFKSNVNELGLIQLTHFFASGYQLQERDLSKPLAKIVSQEKKQEAIKEAIQSLCDRRGSKISTPLQTDNLLKNPCQPIVDLVSGKAFLKDSSEKNARYGIEVSSQDQSGNVYLSENENAYFYVNNTCFFANYDKDTISILEENDVLGLSTDQGYQFVEQNTDSMALYDLTMGVVPDSIDWFKKRNSHTWTWAQKNIKFFEPVFPDSYIEPLSHRIKNAFYYSFNSYPSYDAISVRSDTAAFFDWPDNGKHSLIQLAQYIFSAAPVRLLKNTVKFVAEFIPALIEETSGYLLDHSKKYLSQSPDKRVWWKSGLAMLGEIVGAVGYYTAKAARQVTMRFTSPYRAMVEAQHFGEKIGGKGLGKGLAILSGLVTLAGFAAAFVFGLPLAFGAIGAAFGAHVLGQVWVASFSVGAGTMLGSLVDMDVHVRNINQFCARSSRALRDLGAKANAVQNLPDNNTLSNNTTKQIAMDLKMRGEKLSQRRNETLVMQTAKASTDAPPTIIQPLNPVGATTMDLKHSMAVKR